MDAPGSLLPGAFSLADGRLGDWASNPPGAEHSPHFSYWVVSGSGCGGAGPKAAWQQTTQLRTFGLPRKRLRFAPNFGRSRRVRASGKQTGNFSMSLQMECPGTGKMRTLRFVIRR